LVAPYPQSTLEDLSFLDQAKNILEVNKPTDFSEAKDKPWVEHHLSHRFGQH